MQQHRDFNVDSNHLPFPFCECPSSVVYDGGLPLVAFLKQKIGQIQALLQIDNWGCSRFSCFVLLLTQQRYKTKTPTTTKPTIIIVYLSSHTLPSSSWNESTSAGVVGTVFGSSVLQVSLLKPRLLQICLIWTVIFWQSQGKHVICVSL